MKAIIFDLDGTLIDSLEDIAKSMNDVLKEFNYEEHPLEDYKRFVGDGALILVQNALPKECDEDEIQKILKRFIEIYDLGFHNNTKPYEGIYELLTKLQNTNIQLGVLSNKPHEFTKKYVNKLFLEFNIIETHGQKDEIPKKPDPAGALDIAKSFNLKPEEIFFIGDTPTDIKTAKNANMKSVGVLWGFRPKKELVESGADFIVENCDELWELITKHKV